MEFKAWSCRGAVLLVLVVWGWGCGGQGSPFSGDLGGGGGGADAVLDAGLRDGGGGELPDSVSPGDQVASDTFTDAGVDSLLDLISDLADVPPVPDMSTDFVGEVMDPGAPWAPCSTEDPCADPHDICLLLPDSTTVGVCVSPCTPGAEGCAPDQACVVPDPEGAPEVGYCFEPAGHLEPCDAVVGRVCVDGRYCLAPLGMEDAICTDFCIQAEALCPDMTSCAPVSEEGAAEGWGACLPVPTLAPCVGDLQCDAQEVCASPVAGETSFYCLPSCNTPGAPCQTGGICSLLDAPGGAMAACVHHQDAAEWCDPERAWVCDDGMTCLDVDDPAGFGRCAAPCVGDLDCAPHEVCAPGATAGEAMGCLPPSQVGPPKVGCSEAWPCDGSDVCVEGACAASCAGGCPEGLLCLEGGCVHQAPAGHGCAPAWGWLCEAGGVCARDTGADSGICASACVTDGDCVGGNQCLVGPDGASLCLTPTGFGGACSFSLGTGCVDDGLCMFLGSAASGFCTAACPGIGQGGCPAGPPGTLADCMLNSGGQTWCAFLCGPFGGTCPDEMTCEASGICLP